MPHYLYWQTLQSLRIFINILSPDQSVYTIQITAFFIFQSFKVICTSAGVGWNLLVAGYPKDQIEPAVNLLSL